MLGPVAGLLRLASWFYGLGHGFRLLAYRRGWWRAGKLECRVISVGNLTLGGTGKTPMVVKIASLLMEQGRRPAILSRGYGGGSREAVNVVSDGARVLLSARQAGDEPVMMARKLPGVPVLTGRDRRQTGRYALDHLGVDTLILDDGFQHLALGRDLNILLLDWQRPFGNRRLFPAGELRDPIAEARRADLICFTRCPAAPGKAAVEAELPPGIPVLHASHRQGAFLSVPEGEAVSPGVFLKQKVAAFTGIVRPDDFRALIERAGADVVHFKAFPDHHPYTEEDCRSFEAEARARGAKFIMVSEKDAVKLPASGFDLPVLAAAIDIDIQEGDAELVRLLQNRPPREKSRVSHP